MNKGINPGAGKSRPAAGKEWVRGGGQVMPPGSNMLLYPLPTFNPHCLWPQTLRTLDPSSKDCTEDGLKSLTARPDGRQAGDGGKASRGTRPETCACAIGKTINPLESRHVTLAEEKRCSRATEVYISTKQRENIFFWA